MKGTAKTMLRLCGAYTLLGAIVLAGILLSNRFVSNGSWDELLMRWEELALSYAVILTFLFVFTFYRLGGTSLPEDRDGDERSENRLWRRLTRFPSELFIFYFCLGVIISQLYRFLTAYEPHWTSAQWLEYGKGSMFDISTFGAFAAIHYSCARWMLRPHIRELRVHREEPGRFRSAAGSIVGIAAIGMVYMQLRLFWYAYSSHETGHSSQLPVLFMIGLIVFAVTYSVAVLMSVYLFRDMQRLISRFRELSRLGRGAMLSRIPVASPYETGELAIAFNSLQERFQREYSRLDQDLELAYHVQEQLLSDNRIQLGGWLATGECRRPMEVGGGFFDLRAIKNGRLILVAGRVTGSGLPSALVMSALLMTLRSEMKDEASTGQLMTTLNRYLMDFMPDNLRVHMGIGILDTAGYTLEWALAGDMGMTVHREDADWTAGSHPVPLGQLREIVYGGELILVGPNDRIHLHTAASSVNFCPEDGTADKVSVSAARIASNEIPGRRQSP